MTAIEGIRTQTDQMSDRIIENDNGHNEVLDIKNNIYSN